MSIIISEDGKNARKIDKAGFDKEKYLQNYIHENPESIPVYEIEEDKKLFVLAREYKTESGPIDALAIDKDGDIYVVETKLFKNPDKRTVVAQALDYGASLWRHSDYSEFITNINNVINAKFHISFEEKVKDFFRIDDEELVKTIEAIKSNLQQGNIKFVILMDSIENKLKDLIVYINQSSQFDIYAVQMEYYKFERYEIIIPKLFGAEVKKNIPVAASSQRKVWDEQSFILQAREKLSREAEKIINLYSFFKNESNKIKWGTGSSNGSFAPMMDRLCKTISPFSIYADGTILVKFSWLDRHGYKGAVDKFYNIFTDELSRTTKIKIPTNRSETFKIAKEDFLDNYEDIMNAIKKSVKSIKL
ncbi:MAG: hypothetical protein WCX23_02805 [Candidatus Paceibacterota bacterium]|jgi:hypothetical protein